MESALVVIFPWSEGLGTESSLPFLVSLKILGSGRFSGVKDSRRSTCRVKGVGGVQDISVQ